MIHKLLLGYLILIIAPFQQEISDDVLFACVCSQELPLLRRTSFQEYIQHHHHSPDANDAILKYAIASSGNEVGHQMLQTHVFRQPFP